MNVFVQFIRDCLRPWVRLHDLVVRTFSRMVRRKPPVRERIPGRDPLLRSRRAAVYVHFDKAGEVHDYVLHQLRELGDAGYRVTFATNSPAFPEHSRARVVPLCKEILWRFNCGYDFGAYKDGIVSIENLDEFDELILMNDSVYGPFWKLADTLATIDRSKVDFWGIADSWEVRYHLQTFFLLFLPAALRSRAFADFWRALPYVNNRRWVIRNGEIALTQTLARHRLRGAALAPYRSAAEQMSDRLACLQMDQFTPDERRTLEQLQLKLLAGVPVNSMHFFWDLLITAYRCPFIKRDLLRSNPAAVALTASWPDLVRSQSAYDISMIDSHLRSLAAPSTAHT